MHIRLHLYLLLVFAFTCSLSFARDAARDLRRLIGYTIIKADTIDRIVENEYGTKTIILSDETAFAVDFLILDPLPLTDVIIFAKPPNSYKALIDNEIYDIMP
jgi:hypothetical protein